MEDLDTLTEVQRFGNWWAKREDRFALPIPDSPRGSKVRQYVRMAETRPGVAMLVGCAAHSAMQIYVAAAARYYGVPGIIYTAARAKRTEATEYAIAQGAEVVEVRPGYQSFLRHAARERGMKLGKFVPWNAALAFHDTVAQCANLPSGIERVVVPTGSGLTAAGVLAGCVGRVATVVAVAVSSMASRDGILAAVTTHLRPRGMFGPALPELPTLQVMQASGGYSTAFEGKLPNGDQLDPYYAAKALSFIRDGDCLWISGCRPKAAFPRV